MCCCLTQGPGLAAASGAACLAPSGLSREQKAKLLWGSKKDAAAAGIAPVGGSNQWEAAEFDNAQQKLKFQRLMGAHPQQYQGLGPMPQGQQGLPAATAATAIDAAATTAAPRVMGRTEQAKVLRDVEQQFVAGLRRADGRTVGQGL